MTTAIVICAGEATRWQDHTGVPKHLVAPEGERLVDRTARLFREAGAERVLVVSKPGDSRYDTPRSVRVDARLDPNNADADKFLSSRHLWSDAGRTVVAYGDVWFEPEAVAGIMADRDDWTLYCRPGPSLITGATSGECFAVGFHPRHHAEYEAALHHVAGQWRAGLLKRCGGWETYRRMCGAPDLRKHRMYGRFVEIGGWVEDFDKPRDYDEWCRRRLAAAGGPSVSVVVPWRPDSDDRVRAWEWVRRQWAANHPGWQVVTGVPPKGPWRKAAAVAEGLRRADGDILVVADADVWCNGASMAVTAVDRGAPWAVPHGLVYRLAQPATRRLLDGAAPATCMSALARAPYRGVDGGGVAALRRDLYRQAPLDFRFVGWGQEDTSWALALTTLAGRPWRGVAPLWHLWHEPQPRLNPHIGSSDSQALHVRYQYAAKAGPEAMRQLLAEGIPDGAVRQPR